MPHDFYNAIAQEFLEEGEMQGRGNSIGAFYHRQIKPSRFAFRLARIENACLHSTLLHPFGIKLTGEIIQLRLLELARSCLIQLSSRTPQEWSFLVVAW